MEKITLNNYEAYLLDYFEGNLGLDDLALLKTFLNQHPELAIDLNDEKLPSLNTENLNFEFKSEIKKSDVPLIDEELVNYLENNLNAEQKVFVEQKLKSNPDLQKLLLAYKKTILSIENIADFNKNILYKTEDEFILQNKSFLYMEGLLGKTEAESFELELQKNETLQKELSLLNKTKLASDQSVVYPDKSELKKEAKLIVLYSYRKIAAIAAAILLLVGLYVITSKTFITSTQPIEVAIHKAPTKNAKTKHVIIDSINKNVRVVTNNPIPLITKPHIAYNNKLNTLKASTSNTHTTAQTEGIAHDNSEKQVKDTINIALAKQPIPNSVNDVKAALEIDKTETQFFNTTTTTNSETLTNTDILEVEEDEELAPSNKSKNKFWNKVVLLAKQANRIGIKKIELEERTKNSFVLSFNSISVEKK